MACLCDNDWDLFEAYDFMQLVVMRVISNSFQIFLDPQGAWSRLKRWPLSQLFIFLILAHNLRTVSHLKLSNKRTKGQMYTGDYRDEWV